jgi:PadR family transcriptional regulator, regulatory protein PadR
MPAWQHGYDLAKTTGLKPGTLYPMLSRLAEHGFLETMWEQEQPTGRPRRHLYRLTPDGATAATGLEPGPAPQQSRPPVARLGTDVRHAH